MEKMVALQLLTASLCRIFRFSRIPDARRRARAAAARRLSARYLKYLPGRSPDRITQRSGCARSSPCMLARGNPVSGCCEGRADASLLAYPCPYFSSNARCCCTVRRHYYVQVIFCCNNNKKGLESSSKILSSSIIVEAPELAHLLFDARLRKLLSSLQRGLSFFV